VSARSQDRSAIQTLALRLFREQGYDATTVQQIIEEADVSESTFFRYFPTKADVVLFDDFDPSLSRLPPSTQGTQCDQRVPPSVQ